MWEYTILDGPLTVYKYILISFLPRHTKSIASSEDKALDRSAFNRQWFRLFYWPCITSLHYTYRRETTRSLTLQLHDTFPEAQPDLLVTQSRRCSGTLRAWKDSTIERAHRPGHSMCYPWSTLAGYSSLYTDVYQTSLRMV
jgi:hypothetical protein